MKDARIYIAGLTVMAAALTGCGSVDTAKDEAAKAHTEGLADVHEAKQRRDYGEAYEAQNSAEPSPAHDANPETETVTSSPEPSRHWLAPPPAPAAAETDPEAWADYKYVEWLHGMNTTYREMCGELKNRRIPKNISSKNERLSLSELC